MPSVVGTVQQQWKHAAAIITMITAQSRRDKSPYSDITSLSKETRRNVILKDDNMGIEVVGKEGDL